jgi:hypothetical protein
MINNGGPVMLGQTHIYYIYYGNWSVDPNASTILSNFANNLAGSGYYNTLTQYNSGNSYISNSVALAGSTASTYVAANPTNLSDSDIQSIVQTAISSHSLPLDSSGVYFVLTAPGVGESSGFLSQYCGWHTAGFLSNTYIKYAFVGDAGNNSGCSVQFGSSPNGDPPVDAMISVIAHELAETVTDPLLNAWYDASGYEIGDKCAWVFGSTFATPNGSTANITLGGFDFLIQQEFSNASDSCVTTYAATPDYALSLSPSSQTAAPGKTTGNYTVTVNPSSQFTGSVTMSIAGVPAGATLNAFTPNPTTTTSTFSINVGTASPGSYALTITGASGALTHSAQATLVVSQPDFSLSAAPSPQTVVQGATTANSYVVSVTSINGFSGSPTLTITPPAGATVNMVNSNSFTVTAGATMTPGTYSVTVKGTSGSISHTTTAALVVSPVGAFTINITPSSQTVKRKGSVQYSVTVTGSAGFNSKVTLSISGLPNHATSNFNPSTITGSGTTTLTIGAGPNTPTGTSTFTVTGAASGLAAQQAKASITVD